MSRCPTGAQKGTGSQKAPLHLLDNSDACPRGTTLALRHRSREVVADEAPEANCRRAGDQLLDKLSQPSLLCGVYLRGGSAHPPRGEGGGIGAQRLPRPREEDWQVRALSPAAQDHLRDTVSHGVRRRP